MGATGENKTEQTFLIHQPKNLFCWSLQSDSVHQGINTDHNYVWAGQKTRTRSLHQAEAKLSQVKYNFESQPILEYHQGNL